MDKKTLLTNMIQRAKSNHAIVRPIQSCGTWPKSLIRRDDHYELYYEIKIDNGWSSSIIIDPLTQAEKAIWAVCPEKDIYLGALQSS